MIARVFVADADGNVFGDFELNADNVGLVRAFTVESIGEEVIAQLPGGLNYLTTFAVGDRVLLTDPDAPPVINGEPAVVKHVYGRGVCPFPGERPGEYVGDEPSDGQFYLLEMEMGGETIAGQADLEAAE